MQHWDQMTAEQKAEYLRGMVQQLQNQIAQHELTISEMGSAIVELEKKLGANR
jgi:hypothetical protein